jgi:hypothetical protein
VSARDEYMIFAEICRRLAAGGDATAYRGDLERMAKAWARLAAEEERIADFMREVDNLFDRPEAIDELLRRADRASH